MYILLLSKVNDLCERKRRFHVMKMVEMKKMMNEKEAQRRSNVEQWKNYFDEKLKKQDRTLTKSIMFDKASSISK